MIADPLVVTIAGAAKSLNKINQGDYGSEFLLRESLKEYRAKIRHSKTKPDVNGQSYDRHNFELTVTTFATSSAPENVQTFYFVMHALPANSDVELADAVMDLMIASSDALMKQMVAWQS
jgi:hypothetical protein